jgi:hypothetical protein
VLGSKFGIQASHQVLVEGDDQIQAALGLFPRAAAMLSQRTELAKAPELRTDDALRN